MCELIIEIKAPYNITLLIDGKQYSADEAGLYKMILEPEIKHNLEIRVEKFDSKKEKFFYKVISIFRFKRRHTDSFDNVFYKADFTISKNHKIAKIVFHYGQFTTLNFHVNETPVAYIRILRKSKIDILNEEKSVFKNKKDFFIYFIRHRWIEILVAIIIAVAVLVSIFRTFYEHQCDLYKPYETPFGRGFATNPFEDIIERSIDLLLWVVYWTVGNIRFIRRSLRISKWDKDEDNKSAFSYKVKFFF